MQIYYPCFPYLLTQEIHDRRGRKQLFSEQELWYLLFSMSKAQRQNHPNDYIIGDIRPSNIFLNEEGSVKIANRDTWPYYKNKLEKALSNQPTYLAPEELRSIADNGNDFGKFEQQGEAFAIGLTLLSLVNLADYEGLYNLHKMTFDQAAFNEALTQASLNQNYS
jgi:serine/threonine protein kinase